MKTTKKALLLALCAVLLVVSTVFATLAYLTTDVKVVKNTFTVGDIEITLDEAPVDEYGVIKTGERVTANTYKLIPGHSYVKDPTVHVAKGSEVCYVFVKVDDGIAAIQAPATVETQMTNNGWIVIDEDDNVWAKPTAIDARAAAQDIKVFDSFTISGTAAVDTYKDANITVMAYAIQADGFASADAAWAAASTNWQ